MRLCVGLQSRDGVKYLAAVPDQGDAELFQILGSQTEQHRGVDFIFAKDSLVAFKSEAAQPGSHIHYRLHLPALGPHFADEGGRRLLMISMLQSSRFKFRPIRLKVKTGTKASTGTPTEDTAGSGADYASPASANADERFRKVCRSCNATHGWHKFGSKAPV
jgi:hypothetical protein